MPQKEEVLRDYLHFIKKYTFVICMCTILVLGTALIVSLRIPKTYSASTLLRLIQSNTSAPISSNNLFQTVLSGGVDRSEMVTIGKRFSTESMLNAAIENMDDSQLGAVQHLPSIGILKRKLKAQIDPEADYIELSIKLTEDEGGERNGALLVNQLARDMQTLRSETEKNRLAKHQKFLENKRNEIDKKIGEFINETLDFVRKNGSPETWYPQLASLLEEYRNGQERLGISELALYTARGRLDHFKTWQDTLPQQTKISETQNKNPIWLYQQEKLIDLESQRIGDSEKAGKSTHELSGLEAQIKGIREQTENTTQLTTVSTYGTSAHYTYLENQLIELPPTIEGYKNETDQLRKELQKTRNQLEELLTKIPENQHTFTQLRANIELAGTLKEEIEKRYLESEILSAESNVTPIQKGGIEIVDIAVPRKIAVSPQFKLIVVLASVVGLCLGVTSALAIEFFQD